MAVHKGRGISAIEYPTGMNQNGDPSQAWIKIKPDGRVDVFSGTADIGNVTSVCGKKPPFESPRNSAAVTPTIWVETPFTRICRPITAGSAPKARRQNA